MKLQHSPSALSGLLAFITADQAHQKPITSFCQNITKPFIVGGAVAISQRSTLIGDSPMEDGSKTFMSPALLGVGQKNCESNFTVQNEKLVSLPFGVKKHSCNATFGPQGY